jgi:putative transposase
VEQRSFRREKSRIGHKQQRPPFQVAVMQALHQAEGGEKVAEICRRLGVSEQTFYRWKRQFAGLGLSELRELRSLRHENSKLKQVVADLTLDRHILIRRSYEQSSSRAAPGASPAQRRANSPAPLNADPASRGDCTTVAMNPI